jgi:hypothetical protein
MSTSQVALQDSQFEFSPEPESLRLPGPGNQQDVRLALIALFDRLCKGDLTAAGYKIALSTLARLLRQGRITEAMPVDAVGEALGLHRNSVGAAYQVLVDLGLVRRIANPNRGAPTRTTLTGPALALAKVLGTGRLNVGDLQLLTTVHHTASTEGPSQDVVAPPAAPAAMPAVPDRMPPEAVDGYPARVTPELPSHNETPPPSPSAVTEPDLHPSQEAYKEATRFSPETYASMRSKLSNDVMYDALQGRLRAVDIKPDWGLTDEETACLLNMCAKIDAPAPAKPKKANPTVRAVPTSAEPRIAKYLFESLPRLANVLGEARAGAVIDEIAFAVTHNNLGHGDRLGGARAGVSIALLGKWNSPHRMPADWFGAVLRGLYGASPKGDGDAQENVR